MRTVHQYDEATGRNLWDAVQLENLAYEEVHEFLSIETDGQTVFTLLHAPILPHLSELCVNGVRARFGLQYTIDGTQLEWISGITLETTDSFTIDYMRTKS